jgi:hypothetical protein
VIAPYPIQVSVVQDAVVVGVGVAGVAAKRRAEAGWTYGTVSVGVLLIVIGNVATVVKGVHNPVTIAVVAKVADSVGF